MRKILIAAAALAVAAATFTPALAASLPAKNVVLVHGAFADGSGWQGVYKLLKKDGYNVTVVQNPTTSFADDLAITKRAIDQQDGPVVLVGHSYGGAVITEAGTSDKVKAVVYVAAFAPDKGESVASLLAKPIPGAPVPPILPPVDGYLSIDKTKFAAAFAADVDPATAAFMADAQVPWGAETPKGTVTDPAWKSKPSYYLVAKDDLMIPPAAQRQMAKRIGATTVETAGSHAVFVSHPKVVTKLIEEAATK